MTDLTLAESLLLVALDDEGGADTANWGTGVEAGLAGALLLELLEAGCLEEEDGKLLPSACDAPADPVVAAAVGSAVSDVQAATMAAIIAASSAATVTSGDGGGGS